MTPALEAGRECDAAVAVDVMGLSLLADTDQRIGDAVIGGLISSNGPDGTADVTWNGLRYNGVPFIAGAYNRGASGNSGHGLAWWRDRQGKPWQSDLEAHVAAWRYCPTGYSTDIDAAMLVMEKMREQHHVRIDAAPKMGGIAWWFVQFCRPSEEFEGRAETLPHAICLAALAASRNAVTP